MSIENKIKMAVCGPVDAGKSSLIGVLTKGFLDDGRGYARGKVLKHKHELESGRTSDITFNPLIYKKKNNNIELVDSESKKLHEVSNTNLSKSLPDKKVIQLIDLAGHEKYLKTTVFGVTGLFPDYGFVVIGANTGITKLTKEHLGILLYLKIPIIIIITKIDIAPDHIYKRLCNRLKKLLQTKTFGKVLYFISDKQGDKDTKNYIDHMKGNAEVIPIISLSNKVGTNIDNLHRILYQLPPRNIWSKKENQGSVFYIDSTFQVPGIGLILSGTLKGEKIKLKDKLFVGPFNGKFKEITIRSIHNSIREHISEVNDKEAATLAVKSTNSKEPLERKMIKKGMVVINDVKKFQNNITRNFLARVTILQHSTTLGSGYSPLIHCGPIRQTAKLTLMNNNSLRCNDSSIVKFTFQFHPEFVEKNMIFFFRDGNTKGVGEILDILPN